MPPLIIVDDNALCGRLFRAMLGAVGCRVSLARSAAEAADLARGDVGAAPLFLVSARHLAADIQEIAQRSAGRMIELRKPVVPAALEAMVRRELGAAQERELATAAE